jgi:ATP-binding protein involved in chromosome partitioning
MSNNLDQNQIKSLLQPIIDTKMLSGIVIRGEKLDLIIELSNQTSVDQQNITKKIEDILYLNFKELKEIRVIFNINKAAPATTIRPKVHNHIPNVKKIILFASAKGGVGKSTTATNVAVALANLGFSAGLVDADIYGPTIPKLLGINQKPEIHENKMIPIQKHGIHSISIGYLIDETQAAIWRGPMISKTLYQLLLGVTWPKLDYLIVDMPPGTGDIYLSLAENFIIDGVVLLTTPQKIAFNMVKKSISFFNKTNIPIIGIVENMSYFFDPIHKVVHNIFGQNLSEDDLMRLGLNLLGRIPLISKISHYGDIGKTLLHEEEFSTYNLIAKKVSEKLKELS